MIRGFGDRRFGVAHLDALGQLDEAELNENLPEAIGRLLELVRTKLAEIPE